ncbi:MAG: hypothetical protein K1X67_15050 [Fimbriimonadaceae bacterium]|nr:hypothetical protein [Fimbriimonadaceae bacterium]
MVSLIASLLIGASAPQRLLIESASGILDEPQLYTVNADGTGLCELGAGESAIWSPDGKRVAFVLPSSQPLGAKSETEPYDLFVVNADGTARRKLAGSISDFLAIVGWTGDSNSILFSKGTSEESFDEFWLMPVSGSSPRKVGPSCMEDYFDLSISPKSDMFVASISVGTMNKHEHILTIFNSKLGSGTPICEGEGADISPNGRHIAFEADGRLIVVNADGTSKRDLGSLGAEGYFEWLPDSSGLVFDDRSAKSLSLIRLDGSTKIRLGSHLYEAYISPNSDRAICGDGKGYLLCDFKTGATTRIKNSEDLCPISWSADGTRFYASTFKGDKEQLSWFSGDGQAGGILIDDLADEVTEDSISADGTYLARFAGSKALISKLDNSARKEVSVADKITSVSWCMKPTRTGGSMGCCD